MTNTMESKRITYKDFFVNQILSDFYSPGRRNGSAMNCADKFRDEEWRLDGNDEYASNTRSDLYELGLSDPRLMEWIIDVIACMQYNRSMEME